MLRGTAFPKNGRAPSQLAGSDGIYIRLDTSRIVKLSLDCCTRSSKSKTLCARRYTSPAGSMRMRRGSVRRIERHASTGRARRQPPSSITAWSPRSARRVDRDLGEDRCRDLLPAPASTAPRRSLAPRAQLGGIGRLSSCINHVIADLG